MQRNVRITGMHEYGAGWVTISGRIEDEPGAAVPGGVPPLTGAVPGMPATVEWRVPLEMAGQFTLGAVYTETMARVA